MKYNVEIFDSTLRDGAQAEGISFSVEDKLEIVKALDKLGVSYVEAGNPGSNPKDLEFFEKVKDLDLKNAQLVAFGSTRRKDIKVEDDANVKALLTAKTDIVAIFGKCWDLHVEKIINTTRAENLKMIYDTCKFLKDEGKRVFFDAEHFFDGYKNDSEYSLSALKSAHDAGAECLVLCDTNGACFPDEIYEITKKVDEMFKGKVGIHVHNDTGMAVANSIMSVKAGATQVQGTFLGYGERCGNANLSTIIPNLQLKCNIQCIPEENMKNLTSVARTVAEISNISLKKSEPFVGISAFAHKAGMHADGVLKLSRSFEHTAPEVVGNERRFLMSEISGRTAVFEKIKKVDATIEKHSSETTKIIETLKKMEQEGYQYEGADASFEMLIRRITGAHKDFFELINYKIITGVPCEKNYTATATVKIQVENKSSLTCAEGNGPINAIDIALRSALENFYPTLKDVRLIDYKVRVMDSKQATGASVRVLITSTDGEKIWTTVGVSKDVVEASRMALTESIEYKLLKDKENNLL